MVIDSAIEALSGSGTTIESLSKIDGADTVVSVTVDWDSLGTVMIEPTVETRS